MSIENSGYGRTLFERDIPRITKSLHDIAIELKRMNDMKEKENTHQGLSTEEIEEIVDILKKEDDDNDTV